VPESSFQSVTSCYAEKQKHNLEGVVARPSSDFERQGRKEFHALETVKPSYSCQYLYNKNAKVYNYSYLQPSEPIFNMRVSDNAMNKLWRHDIIVAKCQTTIVRR
jgi:hypothetical protein